MWMLGIWILPISMIGLSARSSEMAGALAGSDSPYIVSGAAGTGEGIAGRSIGGASAPGEAAGAGLSAPLRGAAVRGAAGSWPERLSSTPTITPMARTQPAIRATRRDGRKWDTAHSVAG